MMTEVERKLQAAELVVAVLTDGNANVTYEVGLAHAFHCKVILISEERKDLNIPFDLRPWAYLPYNKNNLGRLGEDLAKWVDGALREQSPEVLNGPEKERRR